MVRLVMDEIEHDSLVYLTEQVTLVYQAFRKCYKNVIGSEYLAPDIGSRRNNKGEWKPGRRFNGIKFWRQSA